MKKILLLVSFVCAAANAAVAQNTLGFEQSAAILSAESDSSVAKGMTREAVSFQLGAPNETLGANVWVYWNFHVKGTPDAAKYDTLLVRFAGNEVATLHLAESQPVRTAIAKFKAHRAATKVASAK